MTPKAASSRRKKATAGIIFLVLVLMVWQISSMFGKAANLPPKGHGAGGVALADATPAKPAPIKLASAATAAMPVARGTPHSPGTPVPPQISPVKTGVPEAPMTDREIALMKLNQETQVKYLEAINELQMLKVARDIAMTNKDISAAKEATVESDKKIIDMLSGGEAGSSQASSTQVTGRPTAATLTGGYNLVSITQLLHRWAAVISSGGSLYNVSVGDTLPSDGSTVIGITKDSVTLQKDGERKKLSLVPII